MPWITEPAAWLRASAGAAIFPTAMPVATFNTRTCPSQVSTATSITGTDLDTPAPIAMLDIRRIIQPKIVPMSPASFNGERMPGSVGLLSSGRTAQVARSGEAAISSRHGALEPGVGGRFELCTIAAFNAFTARSVGGVTAAVVLLPVDDGPSRKVASAI